MKSTQIYQAKKKDSTQSLSKVSVRKWQKMD